MTYPKCNNLAPIDRFEKYLAINRVPLTENQHFNVVQYWQNCYKSLPDFARFVLNILAIPPISVRLFLITGAPNYKWILLKQMRFFGMRMGHCQRVHLIIKK